MKEAPEDQTKCPGCGRPVDPASGCVHCLLQLGKTANDSTSFGTATPYDHYRIVTHSDGSPAEIGRGGMGVTYKAFDKNLRFHVALKVIHQRLLADSSMRERFLREARHAAQLRHPNVASVLHLGTSAEQCFYTMELIEGESVEQLVQRAGPVESLLALRIVSQVASALTAAAKLRLVHRDIKPSNLMLVRTEAGELLVKVIDFGIAVSLDNKMIEENATRQGTSGTLQFASPEQLRHQPVDVRSDIYSLGMTLWYMLAGRPPFTGSKTQMINGQLTSPPPFDQLSSPLCVRRLLERMLEKDPGKRFSTPVEVQRAIAECLGLLGPTRQTATAGKKLRRNTLIATGVVAALIVAAGTYKLLYLNGTPGGRSVQSIAVLPFHALDGAAQTGLVAEGIHDEVLASLARHSELKVISNGSVLDPRLATMSPAQKGNILGVKNLLEGSLQRLGNEYHVNARLIYAPTGTTLHAQTYQAGDDDLFDLQSRIARDMTEALGLPNEKTERESAPTENLDAYNLYLQAREVERQPENEMGTNARKAAELYERALSLDRNFVLAEIRLAYLYARLHWQEDDWNLRATYLTKAESAVEHLVKLQPQLPETHAALGYYYYYGHRDLDHALQEFRIAQHRLPNDSEIAEAIGLVERRKGIWEDSIANLKRATQLDPLNARFLSILSDTYDGLRRYTDEKQVIARERALVGDTTDVRLDAAIVTLKETGSTAEMRRVLNGIDPKDDSDATGYTRWGVNILERKFDQAVADAQRARLPKFEAASAIYPRELLCALAYWSKGDRAAALPFFDKARVAMEPVVAKATEGPRLRIALAMAYAGLGRKDDAIHQGTLAVDERPISVDAVAAPPIMTSLARVYTMLGEKEKALDLLGKISVVPFGSSRSYLKLDPCWDELRNDPRFQQLTQ
jgi:TolB-like protein